MSNLPSKFFAENKIDAPGAGWLIKPSMGSIITKLIKCRTSDDFNNYLQGKKPSEAINIPGYRIIIALWNKNKLDKDDLELEAELKQLAEFYYTHTIKPSAGNFKKYLIE